ncbi:semaphorin-7A isoform X2 [Varanus komodoensis]|uniref:semaphorin-7A isoform X2 n=1 Tax=Varanus komodoensis TaxID=61221 RepID=UPI001CF7BF29|nr:semaphorin-7A isoform X2 [Varanus komodoensis]
MKIFLYTLEYSVYLFGWKSFQAVALEEPTVNPGGKRCVDQRAPTSETFIFSTPSSCLWRSTEGEKRCLFNTSENHIALYHEQGTSSVYVGAENKLYYCDFANSNHLKVPFDADKSSNCRKQEDAKNYLTLLEKYDDKLLICGTNACNPTCWNWVNGAKEPGITAQGLAPFELDQNTLVLVDGKDIYSTIKKHQYNGRIPRFRRIRGSAELYTSDTVMNNPQFVKAAVIKQDQPYKDKIYYFFREDNADWPSDALAPRSISRVAQLCKGDKGGRGSLSAAKWTTFLKATLLCVDSASGRHFHRLQDVFILESDDWSKTKVYGLFSNEWEYSAVCVFTVGEIDHLFRTSPLKGYTDVLPVVRPGQCLDGEQLTPHETFKVADRHPEVLHRVKQEASFYSRHHYQQIRVHQVQTADGDNYTVSYLATDKGKIHKVVFLPEGAMTILEIQPFQPPAAIRAMALDSAKKELFVASAKEVVQLPLAMCGAYRGSCESCVLARDPYCGWSHGKCASIYDPGNQTLLQALSHDVPPDVCATANHGNEKGGWEQCRNVTVSPRSRYYLNCSIESHHANYTWRREGRSLTHCSSAHQHCLYFIDSMAEGLYGTYSCVSQEGWFKQTLATECLQKPEASMKLKVSAPTCWAPAQSFSFWLGLLHMAVIFLMLQ